MIGENGRTTAITRTTDQLLAIDGFSENPQTITALHRIEGFKGGPYLRRHYTERWQSLGQLMSYFPARYCITKHGGVIFLSNTKVDEKTCLWANFDRKHARGPLNLQTFPHNIETLPQNFAREKNVFTLINC